MKKNRIVVFNRITGGDSLEDASVFEDLAGSHYGEFCSLYEAVALHDFIQYIDDINCKLGKKDLKFSIVLNTPYNKKIRKKLSDNIKEIHTISEIELKTKNKSELTISIGI